MRPASMTGFTVKRPPIPDPEVFDDAACRADPPLHDSRSGGESDTVWQDRFARARRVCATCPVRVECAQLRDHAYGNRRGIDGIMAGEVTTQRKGRSSAM